MSNILLVFLNELENIEEFNSIIDKFAEHGYAMYLWNNIKKDENFSIDMLPIVIANYKNEYEDLNKIVVLSNVRDLIFSWYRCYNSVVDDFIYFIDKDDKCYFNVSDRHYNFYYNLAEFNGIEEETVEGQIYININFSNYEKIIKFLLLNNNFKYFNNIVNFDYKEKGTVKKVKTKTYIFKGYEYNFAMKTQEKVVIIDKLKEAIIDEQFINHLLNNRYLIPYVTVNFYKANNNVLTNILLTLFVKLKEMKKEEYKGVYEELFAYISRPEINFKERFFIASLLVMINGGDERLTELMMKSLLEDQEYVGYHHEILANILFYHTNENLVKYHGYEDDRRNFVSKLSKLNRTKISIKKTFDKKNIRKVAIVTDQLLSIYHSPTKWILYFMKSIKQVYPNVEVKLIVEDNLYCKKAGKILPYLYSSIESKEYKSIHEDFLRDIGTVYYANNEFCISEKIKATIQEINDFSPDVIFFTTPISLSVRNLYDYYPLVYMSFNDFNFTIPADVYLQRNKSEVIKENEKYNLLNIENVYEYNPGTMFESAQSTYLRKDYGIADNDFVMVTVGNRLDAEISDSFVDMVISFMKDKEGVKWLIVGKCTLPYLRKTYNDILTKKIIKIDYEYDLHALYKLCDIYLNPIRTTGGSSITMAMYEKLPIVISSNHSDAINYVGFENTCGYGLDEMYNEIDKLYKDKVYREELGKRMRERINLFDYKKDIEQLWVYFYNAIVNFNNRLVKGENYD